MNKDAYDVLTEAVNGNRIGRDPRKVSPEDFKTAGHSDQPLSKIIRAKCKDCCSGSESEVKLCTAVACPLWPYRMGKNPFRHRELSDEQRAIVAERFKKARAKN